MEVRRRMLILHRGIFASFNYIKGKPLYVDMFHDGEGGTGKPYRIFCFALAFPPCRTRRALISPFEG